MTPWAEKNDQASRLSQRVPYRVRCDTKGDQEEPHAVERPVGSVIEKGCFVLFAGFAPRNETVEIERETDNGADSQSCLDHGGDMRTYATPMRDCYVKPPREHVPECEEGWTRVAERVPCPFS